VPWCCTESRGLELIGSGAAFPVDLPGHVGREWGNQEFLEFLLISLKEAGRNPQPWDADEPFTRFGVQRRQWLVGAAAHVGDLAVEAAQRAINAASIKPEEIDLLITATSTPARITSSLAGYVSSRLSLTTAAFDVRAGGAAALFAWINAVQFLRHEVRTALIVAAETPSRFCNRDALLECSLLGDGAAAIIVRRSDDPCYPGGFLGGFLETRPVDGKPWTVPGPLPPTVADVESRQYEFQSSDPEYNARLRELRIQTVLDGRAAYPAVVAGTRCFVSNAPTRSQVLAERDAVAPPAAQTISTLQDHGFLGSAGPLAALHELRASGSLTPGEIIAFSAVGGGLHRSWMAWQV